MNYNLLRRSILILNNAPDGFLVETENVSINFAAFPQEMAQPSVKGTMIEKNVPILFGDLVDMQPISVLINPSPSPGSSVNDILGFRKNVVSLFVRNLP